MVRVIPLTQAKVALVDDEDYDDLMQFKWCAVKVRRRNLPDVFYACRTINFLRVNGKKTTETVYMHRCLCQSEEDVDHKDGNGLNNQRANLRPATRSQNVANSRGKRTGASSRFRGVGRYKKSLRWQSVITVQGKRMYLGSFSDEEEAARVYDAAAQCWFGEFAQLNFPVEEVMPLA